MQVRDIILADGGEIVSACSWNWAYFADEVDGLNCFLKVHVLCETTGYYPAEPDSSNPNLRRGGFRFR